MSKAKKQHPSFKFDKNDSIGAAGAEEDYEFLKTCFVDTGDLAILEDLGDRRQLLVGRTGTGKTALLQQLVDNRGSQAIVIDPEGLALTYVANSTILRFFSELGVNLDPFFKLLWRHVMTVEVLDRHFHIATEQDQKGLLGRVLEFFRTTPKEEKEARQALAYLEEWGKSFWLETEFRVREITRKVEDELGSEVSTQLGPEALKACTSLQGAHRLSAQERSELLTRGQQIISQAQVQDLNRVIQLLDKVLSNNQKGYYIVIDRLDEGWVEDKLRYKLIMGLILTSRDFLKVRNAKVIVAMRKDLIDRVFRLTRDSGFQQEKYESLYLRLHWTKENILAILDRRIENLVSRRYTNVPVTHKDLLPKMDGLGEYLFARAPRPRDIIDFFNKCILAATDQSRLTASHLRTAEGEYSKSRLRAVGDEWSSDHPDLLDFVALLRGHSASSKVSKITRDDIDKLCLRLAAEAGSGAPDLTACAVEVINGHMAAEDFRIRFVLVLYKTGIVGLKLAPHEKPSWDDERGRAVSAAEVDDETSIVIHPAYHRALGIRG